MSFAKNQFTLEFQDASSLHISKPLELFEDISHECCFCKVVARDLILIIIMVELVCTCCISLLESGCIVKELFLDFLFSF